MPIHLDDFVFSNKVIFDIIYAASFAKQRSSYRINMLLFIYLRHLSVLKMQRKAFEISFECASQGASTCIFKNEFSYFPNYFLIYMYNVHNYNKETAELLNIGKINM